HFHTVVGTAHRTQPIVRRRDTWNFSNGTVVLYLCERRHMNMTILRNLGLLALLLLPFSAIGAQDTQADAVITLERTACFGACPIYTVSILADGTVLYNGERFVDVEGEQAGQIEPETVAEMVEAFEAAGYF